MNKYIHILKNIGLSEHAANIYVGLLENGSSNVTQITESTWLQRIQIYRNLPSLLDRWLVFVIKKWKRKIYSPASPDILKQEYETLQKNTFHVLDELGDKYKSSQNETNIVFWKWVKAIQNMYHDVLSTLDTWWVFYRISSERETEALYKKYHPKDYRKVRDEKWIERMIIFSDHIARKKTPKLEREMKIIDSKMMEFDDNIIFTIYWNKVSLIDFNKETCIIIESEELARFQEKTFKLLFKKL